MGKTSSTVIERWKSKAYDVCRTYVPKGARAQFKEACEKRGTTMNAVLRDAVLKYIEETDSTDTQ